MRLIDVNTLVYPAASYNDDSDTVLTAGATFVRSCDPDDPRIDETLVAHLVAKGIATTDLAIYGDVPPDDAALHDRVIVRSTRSALVEEREASGFKGTWRQDTVEFIVVANQRQVARALELLGQVMTIIYKTKGGDPFPG